MAEQNHPRERGILFQGDMVRALLAGLKTQTRRAVKPQPVHDRLHRSVDAPDAFVQPGEHTWWSGNHTQGIYHSARCPFGQVSDRLWVREAWSTHACFDDVRARDVKIKSLHYWADGDIRTGRKRASMHMPRWASRITLEITGVRVERLQDISAGDALAEGISTMRSQAWDRQHFPTWRFQFDDAVAAGTKPPVGPQPQDVYRALWEAINGAGSWQANPWVWVVEFRRVAVSHA